MDEIVEMGALRQHSSADGQQVLPRSRSSTTILLRSSGRVMPNSDNPQDATKRERAAALVTDGKGEAGGTHHGDSSIRKAGFGNFGCKQHKRNRFHLGCRELASAAMWQCALVEFVGSLILTFVSVAAVISCLKAQFSFPRIAIAFTQFLIYTACILATAPVSGGHLNPSFSFTTMLTGHISFLKCVFYILAQSLGSIFGALIVKLVVSQDVSHRYFLGGCLLKQQVMNSDFILSSLGADAGPGIVAEIIFTLLLIAVAFPLLLEYSGSTHFGDPRLVKGAIITGLVLGVLIFVSGELLAPGYTSAGMNPARCFGPAMAEGGADLWRPQWVFWLGPLLAGFIFGILYQVVHWGPHGDRFPITNLDRKAAQSNMPFMGESAAFQMTQPNSILSVSAAPPSDSVSPHDVQRYTAPNDARRMDVFLHIKAMMHKADHEEVAQTNALPHPATDVQEIADYHPVQPAPLRHPLQSFMDLPSTSAGPSCSLALDTSNIHSTDQ